VVWNAELGGLPSEEFLVKVVPYLRGSEKNFTAYLTSAHLAGRLSAFWAEKLGLQADIPYRRCVRCALGCNRSRLPH